jgi:uncharacterized repeat protein (TIGR01451 family)
MTVVLMLGSVLAFYESPLVGASDRSAAPMGYTHQEIEKGTKAEWRVCPAGPPDCDYSVIQNAADAAGDGDIIKVATGVYAGVNVRPAPPGYPGPSMITQVVYISKSVTLRGGYDTAFSEPPDPVTNLTTLDAQGQGRVLVIGGAISPTIGGLRITGGDATGLGGGRWSYDAGGGMYSIDATTTFKNNQVVGNIARYGGGLALWYSEAWLNGNTIISNTAGEGGAGLYIAFSGATVEANTISNNTCHWQGGGLWLGWGGTTTISGNIISSNAANGGCGGLLLLDNATTLANNIVTANTAIFGDGGGLCVIGYSDSVLSENTITGNTAEEYGGGLGLFYTNATLINNLVVDNQAGTAGAGLYIARSAPYLLHTTVARNSGGDGSGVYVTDYSGTYSNVTLTNTILLSHTVGIHVTAGNTATLEATLWGNESDSTGGGTILTGTINLWGSPAFVDPDAGDYHIRWASAARDAGVDAGVTMDIDGQRRPLGPGHDIGVDETGTTVMKWSDPDPVTPGAQLTYTLSVANTSDVPFTASITDVLPPQVTPTGVLTWSAQITPGGVWTETVIVTVDLDYLGQLTNVVQVNTEEGSTDVYTHVVAVEEPILGVIATNDSPTVLGDPTTFTATVTAGSNVTYAWDFGDGAFGRGAVVTHTYPGAISYTAIATVSNGVSLLTATTAVTILPACYPVTATMFSWTPLRPMLDDTITFTAIAWAGLGSWFSETVDSTTETGLYSSLALDADDHPHIGYHERVFADYNLKHAWHDGVSWNIETVDSGHATAGASLVLDQAGHPHISYYDGSTIALKYARFDGTSWNTETVDAGGNAEGYTSLALDAAGHPHISYVLNWYLKYAYHDGDTWQIEIIDGLGNPSHGSLALDSYGRPHVSYYSSSALRYAWHDGTDWTTEIVDSGWFVGMYSSLALDGAGRPHISYHDGTNYHLKYAYKDSGAWTIETVDSNGFGTGTDTSLVLDAFDWPHISYLGSGSALKYAWYDGTSWQVETLDQMGGPFTSLFLDEAFRPHTSYQSGDQLRYGRLEHLLPTPPITFTWDFGDGVTGTGEITTHAYTTADRYTVTLVAANDCSQVQVSHTLIVKDLHEIYLPLILRNH